MQAAVSEKMCAPWCGRGCTRAEHDRAKRRGKALAKSLGRGWTVRVWENLGWHYAAHSPCGRIKVHESRIKTSGRQMTEPFTAFLGEATTVGGRWAAHGRTPQEAVAAVIAQARAELEKIQALVEGIV